MNGLTDTRAHSAAQNILDKIVRNSDLNSQYWFLLSSQYCFCEDREVFRGGESQGFGDSSFSPGVSQVRGRCWE